MIFSWPESTLSPTLSRFGRGSVRAGVEENLAAILKCATILFFLFCAALPASAQVDTAGLEGAHAIVLDSVYTVERVVVSGNTRTKEFVILREMALAPGAYITQDLLEYDRQRIYSLGLFTRVEVFALPVSMEKAQVIVEVSERWYIYPFPVFGIKDRDWDKFYYGLGLMHMNFRGRNEKIFASFALGYDPWISLAYRNPFLDKSGTYFLDARFVANTVRNKSQAVLAPADENFDERHLTAGATLGRRFALYHTAWVNLGYETVTASDYKPGRTIAAGGTDRFAVTGAGYAFDTRDLQEYPSSGSFVRGTVTKYGLPGQELDLTRYALDLRRYVPIAGPFVLSGRAFTNLLSGGPTPSHNRVYFGYGERIRGHFNTIREGENLLGAGLELHYPLLAPRYIVVDFLPREFGVWKFGIVAALFADAGTVWFRSEKLALPSVAKGYGAGIHVILPYSIVVRADYGFNEARKGEFILDAGGAF